MIEGLPRCSAAAVERHVTNALRKVVARNRTELAALLADQGGGGQSEGLPQFTAATAEHVPVFAELDGLLAKISIADPESDTKGAIYLFAGRTALDAYLESDVLPEHPRGAKLRRYELAPLPGARRADR